MSAKITSIKGINNFSNLTNINLDFHQLRTLDVSGLSNLTILDCNDNNQNGALGLSTIHLTGCTALERLFVDDNDFSAGFPDLSDCTSLVYFDADQCDIEGTLDLSNLPNLEGFDLSGNTGLTNVIVSYTQPLGGNESVNCNDTSLTQASVDGILHALASGSMVNGTFDCEDGFQDYPSPYGVAAIRELDNRGWQVNVQQYSDMLILTSVNATGGDACTALLANNVNEPGGYKHKDTIIEVGTPLYDDSQLLTPLAAGWYGYQGDGNTLLINESGVIEEITACV